QWLPGWEPKRIWPWPDVGRASSPPVQWTFGCVRAGWKPALRWCRSLHKPLHIFPQKVCFQIHRVADVALAQGCDFERVRNDPDAETFLLRRRDRETDSVHGDR